MPEPGWVRDPSGRYHQRFFDGTKWTDHVADEYGRRGIDPVDAIQREAPASGVVATTGGPTSSPPAAAPRSISRWPGATTPRGVEVATVVAAAGGFVALVSFVFLPWLTDFQAVGDINALRASGIAAAGLGGAVGPFGVWESSFFDAGWIVSLIAGAVLVFALATGTAGRRGRPVLSAIVAVCTLWAVVGTVMLRSWADDLTAVAGGGSVSFGVGFFLGVVGLLAMASAPLLPERRLGGR
jgi:hypothetical protein